MTIYYASELAPRNTIPVGQVDGSVVGGHVRVRRATIPMINLAIKPPTPSSSRRAVSQRSLIKLSAELVHASRTVRTQIKEVIKRVPRLIQESRDCHLSDELVGVLNRARGDDVRDGGPSSR